MKTIKDKQTELWKNKDSAKHYWVAQKHEDRRNWFTGLLKMKRFYSIYEVGCNSGKNLWHIKRDMPDKLVGGIDINTGAIKLAKQMVPSGVFSVGDIHDLDVTDQYDIVFTSGVLLHVPPKSVKNILQRCLDKAEKYVVHMETNGQDQIINGPAEFNPTKKVSDKLRCVHNYAKMYTELGYRAVVRDIPCRTEDDAQHIIIVNCRKQYSRL